MDLLGSGPSGKGATQYSQEDMLIFFRVDDVELPQIHPKKAFIMGSLEKEIRLSFAQRIRGTLPEPYQPIVSAAKEKDTPDFKYSSDRAFNLPVLE